LPEIGAAGLQAEPIRLLQSHRGRSEQFLMDSGLSAEYGEQPVAGDHQDAHFIDRLDRRVVGQAADRGQLGDDLALAAGGNQRVVAPGIRRGDLHPALEDHEHTAGRAALHREYFARLPGVHMPARHEGGPFCVVQSMPRPALTAADFRRPHFLGLPSPTGCFI
jgi:hypothetical protein